MHGPSDQDANVHHTKSSSQTHKYMQVDKCTEQAMANAVAAAEKAAGAVGAAQQAAQHAAAQALEGAPYCLLPMF